MCFLSPARIKHCYYHTCVKYMKRCIDGVTLIETVRHWRAVFESVEPLKNHTRRRFNLFETWFFVLSPSFFFNKTLHTDIIMITNEMCGTIIGIPVSSILCLIKFQTYSFVKIFNFQHLPDYPPKRLKRKWYHDLYLIDTFQY